MTEFKKAVRENVGLWINLIGGTGSGKTFTAMQLATGICGAKPFAVIDTENGRAEHYAPLPDEKADGKLTFNFYSAALRPAFRPQAYADAILAADAAGYPVIVVDSGSHVWAGDGGVLDWQEEELDRLGGTDYGKRERVKMSAWIKPKMGHKQMVQAMLQVRAHIILCLRAEQKIEMVKDAQGKLVIQAKTSLTGKDGWIPICDKNLPFEATCSFLLLASAPGMPHPIKLQEQHKAIFPLDKPIDAEAGRRLAAWASGTKAAPAVPAQGAVSSSPDVAPGAAPNPTRHLPASVVDDTSGATGRRDGQPSADEALLIKAEEWASCGTEKYAAWWRDLTPAQRKTIGASMHESLKQIAAGVPS